MKLLGYPWKTAWHEDQISDKFFKELAKIENGLAKDLDSSGRWMDQIVIELGQLAQNMTQLETEDPHTTQLRLAFERAVKLSALASLLAGALHAAEVELEKKKATGEETNYHPSVASAVEAATQQVESGGQPLDGDGPLPLMRRTIRSLSDRGVPVPEIEIITGLPRQVVESVLSEG